MKLSLAHAVTKHPSRSPHGERGLKCLNCLYVINSFRSLPTRGAWIEIFCHICYRTVTNSRSPHGERGLKYLCEGGLLRKDSRSPHGERGLKWRQQTRGVAELRRSLPTRGAWIEIMVPGSTEFHRSSLPTRGAWIEIVLPRPDIRRTV